MWKKKNKLFIFEARSDKNSNANFVSNALFFSQSAAELNKNNQPKKTPLKTVR